MSLVSPLCSSVFPTSAPPVPLSFCTSPPLPDQQEEEEEGFFRNVQSIFNVFNPKLIISWGLLWELGHRDMRRYQTTLHWPWHLREEYELWHKYHASGRILQESRVGSKDASQSDSPLALSWNKPSNPSLETRHSYCKQKWVVKKILLWEFESIYIVFNK